MCLKGCLDLAAASSAADYVAVMRLMVLDTWLLGKRRVCVALGSPIFRCRWTGLVYKCLYIHICTNVTLTRSHALCDESILDLIRWLDAGYLFILFRYKFMCGWKWVPSPFQTEVVVGWYLFGLVVWFINTFELYVIELNRWDFPAHFKFESIQSIQTVKNVTSSRLVRNSETHRKDLDSLRFHVLKPWL